MLWQWLWTAKGDGSEGGYCSRIYLLSDVMSEKLFRKMPYNTLNYLFEWNYLMS